MVIIINALLMKCVRTVAISRTARILGHVVLGVFGVQHAICVEVIVLHGIGGDLATFAIDIFAKSVVIYKERQRRRINNKVYELENICF
jgi:hypothetical protein